MRPAHGTLDNRALVDTIGSAHEHDAHVVFFEVQHDGAYAVFEFNQFAGLCAVEAVHAGNTVAHLQYRAHFFQVGVGSEAG